MESHKVLFILTNHDKLGDTGHRTGAYLSEITHPYDELSKAGFDIEMASPLGGAVPLDGISMHDPVNAVYMNDLEFLNKVENTFPLSQVNAKDYCAIYLAGGHGTMFDLPDNKRLQHLITEIYENDGVIGAVCHGIAGLVNVQLPDGQYLIQGHEIACFTNDEERAVGWDKVVPFLLQSRVEECGATHTSAEKFAAHVVKSGRIVTGQNPASALGVGQGIVEMLNFISEGRALPAKNWCEWHSTEVGL